MYNISVTIITITYNDIVGLKKTLNSIDISLTNNTDNIEHLIINGNSTDGTAEYLYDYIKNRKLKTNIISESDLGIYDAMNKGVLYSNNDYLIFINSGDILLRNFNDSDITSLIMNEMYNDKSAGIAFGCNYNIFSFNFKVYPRFVNFQIPRMPTLHQGILYKKAILLKMPYSLNYRICGDFENIVNILKDYYFNISNIFISELTAGGLSTQKPFVLYKESISIFNIYYKPNLFKKIHYYFRLANSLIRFQLIYRVLFFYNKIIRL